MRAYAPRFGGDVELWGLTGLLHDLDYERYPDLGDGHPRYALRELESRGYPPELVRAVASHADLPRRAPRHADGKGPVRRRRAVGLRPGLRVRAARGTGRHDAQVGQEEDEDPGFAAAVNREDLTAGAAELGVDFDEHLSIVIAALAERRDALMPRPPPPPLATGPEMAEHGARGRPGRRRDRPGAARAVAAGARCRTARPRPRAAALRPVAGEPPGHAQRHRRRGGGGDARGRTGPQSGDDHPGGRRRRRLPQPGPARGGRRQGDRPHRTPPAGRGADRRDPSPDLGRAHGGRGRLRRGGVARG